MNVIPKNGSVFYSYISFDTFKAIDTRILLIAAFALGYLFRFLIEPLSRTNKAGSKLEESSNTKKSVATERRSDHSTEKLSTHEELSDASVQAEDENFQTTAPDKLPISKPTPIGMVSQMATRSAPLPVTTNNVITVCYKNILSSEGLVSSPFMKSFTSQLRTAMPGCKVKECNIAQASSSSITGNRVFIYFSNARSQIQHAKLNSELKSVSGNHNSLSDYSILVLTKKDFKQTLKSLNQIETTSNNIDSVHEIMRAHSKTPTDSPQRNNAVAKQIATLVKNRFNI